MAMEDIGGVPAVINGSGGDSWGGIVGLLAIFALFSGGGMWGGRDAAAAATGVSNEFQLSTLNANMESGFNRVTTQQNFDTLDMTLGNIAHSIDAGNTAGLMATKDSQYASALIAKDSLYAQAMGNCEINRNIDGIRTQMTADTSAIIENQNRICYEGQIRALTDENTTLKMAGMEARLMNFIQTSTTPKVAQPAYLQPSPYAAYGYGACLGGVA